MPNIFKFSNAGGFKTLTRYPDMLAGNTVWNPYSPTGAYDALATVSVGSGGASSITFSGIPNTYTHLEIRGIGRSVNAIGGIGLRMQFNGDTGSNYAAHGIYGDGSTPTAYNSVSTTALPVGELVGTSGTANVFGASIITILDYASIVKNKTVRTLEGIDLNGSGYIEFDSGFWINQTSKINSIYLYTTNGNFAQYSSYSLYGVR